MAEESQNALLKTLEEPPGYAHLILITAEPAALLDTVRSRCSTRHVRAAPARSRCSAGSPPSCPGADRGRARGARRARRRRPRPRPPARLADGPPPARPMPESSARAALAGRARRAAPGPTCSRSPPSTASSGPRRSPRPPPSAPREFGKGRDADRIRSARAPTRPSAPTAAPGPRRSTSPRPRRDLVHRRRRGRRGRARDGPQPRSRRASSRPTRAAPIRVAARRSAELAMDTRRRLQVNVNEDLALDALFHRAAGLLATNADATVV